MTSPTLSERARNFIAAHGWADASHSALPVDASTRRYVRLSLGSRSALLMIAARENSICPPHAGNDQRIALGWNATARLSGGRIDAFAAIASHLRALGLSAPQVIEAHVDAGLALVEDLGEHTYPTQIHNGENENQLYAVAAQALAVVHRAPIPHHLVYANHTWPILTYDALALRAGADLFAQWAPQLPDLGVTAPQSAPWDLAISDLIDRTLSFPRSLILRDYHAENLIWIPKRTGVKRTGVIDFQDAVAGWGEWDIDMLIHDARRDVSDHTKTHTINVWLDHTGTSTNQFQTRIAVLGTLNALRIIGIFCRLILRDGKTRYRTFLPRQCNLLRQRLLHPVTRSVSDLLSRIAPQLVPDNSP